MENLKKLTDYRLVQKCLEEDESPGEYWEELWRRIEPPCRYHARNQGVSVEDMSKTQPGEAGAVILQKLWRKRKKVLGEYEKGESSFRTYLDEFIKRTYIDTYNRGAAKSRQKYKRSLSREIFKKDNGDPVTGEDRIQVGDDEKFWFKEW